MCLVDITVGELRRLPLDQLHTAHQVNKAKKSDVLSDPDFNQELYDFFYEEEDIAKEEIKRRLNYT